jgi:hypothetical protein
MSETITQGINDEQVDERRQQRQRDLARLKTVAFQHGAVATGIVLLWGSGQAWSEANEGLLIAFNSGREWVFWRRRACVFITRMGAFQWRAIERRGVPRIERAKVFFYVQL